MNRILKKFDISVQNSSTKPGKCHCCILLNAGLMHLIEVVLLPSNSLKKWLVLKWQLTF